MSAYATTSRPRGAPPPPEPDAAPLCDAAAESALLGSVMCDVSVLPVADITPADMGVIVHQDLWRELCAMHAAGRLLPNERGGVDAVIVGAWLSDRGLHGRLMPTLTAATRSVPTPTGWRGYAARVRELAERRRLASAGHTLMQGAIDGATLPSVRSAAMAALTPSAPAEGPEPPAPRELFPVAVLPTAVGRYVRAVAEALPCAPETVGLPLMAALGSAVGNSRRIRLKTSWSEPAVIWSCTVLPSGKLKSPAMERATQFLATRQQKAFGEYRAAQRQYETGSTHWEDEERQRRRSKLPSEAAPKPEAPTCQRFVTADCTVEALADLLSENPRGLLLARDELSGWFGGFDRYASGSDSDLACYLSMHRAAVLVVDRKTGQRITHVERAAVSITGTIQPGVLRRCLTPEYFERGLPARILMAMPDSPRRRWSEAVVPPNIEQAIDGLFDALLALEPETLTDADGEETQRPLELPLSAAAKTLWVEFYDQHATEQEALGDGHEAAAWSKLEAYAARFALVFALCKNPQAAEIDSPSMNDAIRLTRWFCAETKRVYVALSETTAQREARELVTLIRERFGGRVTERELKRTSRKYQPTERSTALLDGLVAAGLAYREVVTHEGAGRPVVTYTLTDCSHVASCHNCPKPKENANCGSGNSGNTPPAQATPPPTPAPYDPEYDAPDDPPAGLEMETAEATLADLEDDA